MKRGDPPLGTRQDPQRKDFVNRQRSQRTRRFIRRGGDGSVGSVIVGGGSAGKVQVLGAMVFEIGHGE